VLLQYLLRASDFNRAVKIFDGGHRKSHSSDVRLHIRVSGSVLKFRCSINKTRQALYCTNPRADVLRLVELQEAGWFLCQPDDR
jgi:hypothetical protein